MNELRDDCFAFDGDWLPTQEALKLLSERTPAVTEVEQVSLKQALGRVLAEDLRSGNKVPAADNSAVDGYALRHGDLDPSGDTRLRVTCRIAAGDGGKYSLQPGEAARIFTGALMPEGADSVLMQEDAGLQGDVLIVPKGLKAGANRRKAGEDTGIGDIVLTAGRRLRAQEIARAASVGVDSLTVIRKLRIALFSTGDELREPGAELPFGGVYDSNRYLLQGMMSQLPVEISDLGVLRDDPDLISQSLLEAAGRHDLVITSGGVSMGEEDHVKGAVEKHGSLHFWRVAIKPGRPLALGQVKGTPFLGLPGNPVAVMVCFLRFGRVMLLRRGGLAVDCLEPPRYPLPATFEYEKKTGRREWLRARLVLAADGSRQVEMFDKQGSGIIRSLVESDGLVELPEDCERVRPGQPVDFLPFSEVLA